MNLVSVDWCFFANMKIAGADNARLLQPGFWIRGFVAKAENLENIKIKESNPSNSAYWWINIVNKPINRKFEEELPPW